MSGASYSPWDSAEILIDDEVIIEYLKAALEESDPLIVLKAARNVARARGMSSRELPAGVSALSPAVVRKVDFSNLPLLNHLAMTPPQQQWRLPPGTLTRL